MQVRQDKKLSAEEIEALKTKLLEASPERARTWLTDNRIPEYLAVFGSVRLGIYSCLEQPSFRHELMIRQNFITLEEAWKGLVAIKLPSNYPREYFHNPDLILDVEFICL